LLDATFANVDNLFISNMGEAMAKTKKSTEANNDNGVENLNVAGGAAAGAAAGSLLGPLGAAVGAVVGGVAAARAGRQSSSAKKTSALPKKKPVVSAPSKSTKAKAPKAVAKKAPSKKAVKGKK
jgi:secreted PhoX family phosphatase